MLRISLQTLRARRGTLRRRVRRDLARRDARLRHRLADGRGARPPGAGRFAATDAVVRADPTVTIGRGEDAEGIDVIPGPRLPAATVERVAAVPGVARAVGDVAFPAGAWDERGRPLRAERADRLIGHGWDSAALTPYRPDGRASAPSDRATSWPTPAGTRVGVGRCASSARPAMRAIA